MNAQNEMQRVYQPLHAASTYTAHKAGVASCKPKCTIKHPNKVQHASQMAVLMATHIIRVGQNHIYTVYIRFFWQGNLQIYGHIRSVYTVLDNPTHHTSHRWQHTSQMAVLMATHITQMATHITQMATHITDGSFDGNTHHTDGNTHHTDGNTHHRWKF